MNKLKSSLAAKLIAVTLFVLLLMSLAASVLDIAYIRPCCINSNTITPTI